MTQSFWGVIWHVHFVKLIKIELVISSFRMDIPFFRLDECEWRIRTNVNFRLNNFTKKKTRMHSTIEMQIGFRLSLKPSSMWILVEN